MSEAWKVYNNELGIKGRWVLGKERACELAWISTLLSSSNNSVH